MARPIAQLLFKGRVVQSAPLDRTRLTIGRLEDNDIVIDDLAVSRHHATLLIRDGEVVLEDHGSENGCLVNGRRVERATVAPGDEVWICKHQLRLWLPESDAAMRAAAPARTPTATPWDGERTDCLPSDADPAGSARSETGFETEMYAGLIVQHRGRLEGVVPVCASPFVIGRSGDCELTLSHAGVSRAHAQILHEANGWELEDLGSVNGTRLNDHVVQRRRLAVGDEIAIGEFQLTFVVEPKPLDEEIRLRVHPGRQAGRLKDDTEPAHAVPQPPLGAERLPEAIAVPGLASGESREARLAEPAGQGRRERCATEARSPAQPDSLDPGRVSRQLPPCGGDRSQEPDLRQGRALEVPVETSSALAAGRLSLELELDECDLPEPLREALRALGPAPLRIPVRLRLRRAV